jgi:hypothetical protein
LLPTVAQGGQDQVAVRKVHRFKPETAHQWLAAVLLAWTAIMRTELPRRIAAEFQKCFTRIKQELPL